jgi:hypothetical protein
MISYRWVEDCLRNGHLVDPEQHRIEGQAAKTSGTSRSSRRNEFTAADDKLLIDFIKKQASMGASLSGNKIYEEFAVAV